MKKSYGKIILGILFTFVGGTRVSMDDKWMRLFGVFMLTFGVFYLGYGIYLYFKENNN